jgi:apolipoprotein N-acyltransferase
MTVRFFGVTLLGLASLAWLVRNADASKAREGIAIGFTAYFALHGLTSL